MTDKTKLEKERELFKDSIWMVKLMRPDLVEWDGLIVELIETSEAYSDAAEAKLKEQQKEIERLNGELGRFKFVGGENHDYWVKGAKNDDN